MTHEDNDYPVIYDIEPDFEAVVDHADLVLEGTLDTIQGNESYGGGLTHAQKYLKAVMWANGDITESVHGSEGVIDTIKDWASKAVEAIKRAFQAIWDFFFGSEGPEKTAAKLKDEIKETTQQLIDFKKAAANPPKARGSEARKGSGDEHGTIALGDKTDKHKPSDFVAAGKSDNVVLRLACNYEKAAQTLMDSNPVIAKNLLAAAEALLDNPVMTSGSDSRYVFDNAKYQKLVVTGKAIDDRHHENLLKTRDSVGKLHDKELVPLSVKNTEKARDLDIVHCLRAIKNLDDVTRVMTDLEKQISGAGLFTISNDMNADRNKINQRIQGMSAKSKNLKDKKEISTEVIDLREIVELLKALIANIGRQIGGCREITKKLPGLLWLPKVS